ncbi:sigma-70 family RNA polymerase sigma factor [Demequina zhanjiangensis]|uniref:Sigma-70 family RNA polymerase sigma factor n=1 Tax=Demequina zhanjiangensis TaxID=3051659 RepID=A0ABT8G4F0_9MICO|nr:sigma-70 family RNA polymerase sigma factor [Demequina sp. SYSU T00b26]MDN4474020.1 sigma-70 family RNA polymerase sigma factor [Demequina sp. SYSU T00b26]
MSHEAIALWTDSSSDPELIAGVRAGDAAAFGVLYERHVDAARKVAAQYTNTAADIDDVVSESFSRVLRALQRGDGPDLAFRAYLFTIVRRTGMDVINRGARTRPREDMGEYEAALGYGASSEEPAIEGFEQGLVADAFRSLPERWQAVLWYTEVEKKSPKEIAPLLGLSANGVAALAYRAREALRQAYLQQHLATSDQVDCLEANTQLGAYVRGGLSKRETSRVDVHVQSCERCTALVAELEDVNRGMRGIIAPLVMGVLGVGALEGGLPIGGALGAGAAGAASGSGAAGGAGASGTGAGAASGGATATSATSVGGVAAGAAGAGGLASAGAAGTAATAGTVAGFLGTAASLALPIAATVGVVALAATGASYLGLFGPGDEPAAAPVPSETAATASAESPAAGASTPAEASPEASVAPDAEEEPESSGTAEAAPVIELEPASQTSDDDSTSSDDAAAPNETEAPQEPTSEDTPEPEPEPTTPPTTIKPTTPPTTPPPPPPTEPPVALASLSIQQAPLGFLSISSSAPSVPVTVDNDGEGAAEDVTAEITLPDGLTFSTPDAGGMGFSLLQSDLLGDYLTFAAEGTFTVGGWECTLSDDRSTASCDLASLGSGESTTLDLDVDIRGALASDATTSFRVSAGDDTFEYTVRTGLSSASSLLVPAYWTSGQVAATQVGASLLECRTGDHSCGHAADFNGNASMPSLNGRYYDLVPADGLAGRDASNVTELDLPAGATVEYAMLEWAASSSVHDSTFDSDTAAAKLHVPGATELLDITADDVDVSTDADGRAVYQARLDITDLVAAAGAGTYGLADVALANDPHDPAAVRDYYAGFTLTVVYSDDSLPEASVAVYDGTQWVVPGTMARLDLFAPRAANVTVGVVGWGGERGTIGEQLDIDGDTLAPLHWRNGSVSTADSGNAMDSTAFGFANANSFGVDAKSFREKTVGEGLHTLTLHGSADSYLLGSVTFTAVER